MKRFRDYKIGTKYGILFVLIILMVIYTSLNGVGNVGEVKERLDSLHDDRFVPMQHLNDIYTSLFQIRAESWKALASENESLLKESIIIIEKTTIRSKEILDKYKDHQMTEEETIIFNEVQVELEKYYKNIDEFVLALKQGDIELARQIETNSTIQRDIARGKIDHLRLLNNSLSIEHKDNSDLNYNTIRKQMYMLIIIVTSIAIVLFIFITRQTTTPLKGLTEYANTMSTGDLSEKISSDLTARRDEIGELSQAFEKLRSDLGILIHNINDSAKEVASFSKEVLASAQQIAATMEETSASTQEISAGMQEISASTEEINASGEEIGAMLVTLSQEADNGYTEATQIEQRAVKVQENAEIAKDSTFSLYQEIQQRVANAIKEAQVVDQISRLAESIAGFADQTNLLALNAAIEAARAGEHGRGFAVVAEEVRKLAEDSGMAVNDIKELIEQVQSAIQNLVNNSTKILEFINENVIRDYDLIVEMGKQYKNDADKLANITQLFNIEISNISSMMGEINKALENTVTTMEQSNAGSQEIARGSLRASQAANEINELALKMAENAGKLNNLVTQFRL